MAEATANQPEVTPAPSHPVEMEQAAHNNRRLNWLRAGVLGANDGIVAVSGLVIGVAAAGANQAALLTAGLAGLAAGALSMAAGEYVSVSTQRDTEAALIAKERAELDQFPEAELAELTAMYQAKGLTPDIARTVAVQLSAHDALAAHAEVELKIDHEELTNPWQAAAASIAAFVSGSILPLLAILLIVGPARIPITVAAATLSLGLTGLISATLGQAHPRTAILRNVIGGLLAMGITYLIGILVGTHVG